MKAQESHLVRFLQTPNTQFIIPVYQRPYDWRKKQCCQLFADIVQLGKAADVESHFIGSIVYKQTSRTLSPQQLLIIDGQQRLTTVTLLWTVLYKRALEASNDVLAAEIYESYLINKFLNSTEKLKLRPIKHDNAALKHIIGNDGSPVFTGFSRLIENYNILYEQTTPDVAGFVKAGLEKLVFVEIGLDERDDPQKIFQSLNSTGLELSQADLIRNYVLMDLPPELQETMYEQYWRYIEAFTMEQPTQNSRLSDFIRDFLTIRVRTIPIQTRVFEAFKEQYKSLAEHDLKRVLGDLKIYAAYYNALINPTLPASEPQPRIRENLRFINKLGISVAYPFLLEVYHDYAHKRLSEQGFVGILELVQSYIWRRFMCNVPTNALSSVFSTLYESLETKRGDTVYIESLERALVRRRTNQRFPNDWEVQEALNTKDMYFIQPKNRMYFLERLENYGYPITTNVEGNPNISIEHIFPQKPGDVWRRGLGAQQFEQMTKLLNTAANLTLTALEYNAGMGNRPFVEKRDMPERGYKSSNLRLDKFLATLDDWNPETLAKRGEWMFERFKHIWRFPAVSVDAVVEEEAERNIFNVDPNEATGRVLEYATFFDTTLVQPSFKELYRLVTEVMFEREPHVFLSAEFRKKMTVTANPNELAAPIKIGGQYYMDSHGSAKAIIRKIQIILEQCETDDELILKFAPKPER